MFQVLVEPWLDHVRQRSDLAPTTKVEYARIAKHLVTFATGRCPCHVDLVAYVTERRAAGVAPRTLALEVRVAAAVVRWAQKAGLPNLSVMPEIPYVRVDPQRFVENHRTPTPAEAAAVIGAMPHDDWRLATVLLARTGARIGEIVCLRCHDVDEFGSRLALGNVDGASKSGLRWFPLDPASLRDLAGRSGRGDAPLFDFGDVTAPVQGLQRRLRRACLDANVPAFTPHGLRRMVVGRLLRARVDPGTAASLTGHSVEVMLRYYQQVTDEDRRAAVEHANLGALIEPGTMPQPLPALRFL